MTVGVLITRMMGAIGKESECTQCRARSRGCSSRSEEALCSQGVWFGSFISELTFLTSMNSAFSYPAADI